MAKRADTPERWSTCGASRTLRANRPITSSRCCGHDRRGERSASLPEHGGLLRDERQFVGQRERVVRADLGAEAVLERGDDPAAVGVVLGVGAGDEQQVERHPQLVAAHLDVALLEHVEQRDLDALGEVGQLVHRDDAAVGARDQPEVDGLGVAERAALRDLDRVDVADQVADRRVRGGQLLAVPLAAVLPRDRQSGRRRWRATRGSAPHTGAYGWSLISQPATTGVHSSSRPTIVRIRRVLPWPALAEQDDVVAGEQRALDLGHDGVVEADDARAATARRRRGGRSGSGGSRS